MSPRAAPLPPDERRASILDAATPLVVEHGRDVTTKQIATAAGVAEGTIFRAFGDKEALLRAVVARAIDPEPIIASIDAVEKDLPLDEFLTVLVTAMQERIRQIFQIAMAVRWMPEVATRPQPELDPVQRRIVERIGEYTDQLTVEPTRAAEVLRLLIFSSTHPMINEGRPLEVPDIVAVTLDGIRRRDSPTANGP